MMLRAALVGGLAVAMLPVAACTDKVSRTGQSDPSKLSAELENRAREIEEKADMAALAAEREAGAELVALREQGELDQNSAQLVPDDARPAAR